MALLAEIKEMSERNENEDEMVLSIGARHKQCIKPHREFEYRDLDIQEDLYQLIKYACTEVCTPEQCDKVMKFWTTFLEPFKPKIGGVEENCRADEAGHCKPLDMSKNGDEHIPQEDNFASKSDILCNASPGTLGERNINGENASASVKLKGTDKANSDSVTELIPRKESQDGAITRLATSSICMVPEEVKAQKHCKETDACCKAEREEGEFFPNINLEENEFSASGNNDTKLTQTHCKSDPNTREIGGEQMSIVEAGEQNDPIDDDEAEGSTHGSSESEHAFENGDVSVSNSAKGEERSSEEPGEDGDPDKKCDSEGTMPFLDRFPQTVKPLKMKVPEELHDKEKNSQVFYGNDSFYFLFRLHQSAKLHSSSPQNKWWISNSAKPTDSYARFKDALHSLLNGSSDNTKFEDECRAIIGAQYSYLNEELLSVVPERKAKPRVFLNRNKKIILTGGEAPDISKAVGGLIMHNGMEMKVNCNSLKISYVLDTEDFLYWTRKRTRVLYGSGSPGGASNVCPRRAIRRKLIYSWNVNLLRGIRKVSSKRQCNSL